MCIRDSDGSGDKAIGILRNLAQNYHFNLVIVHTKGIPANLDKVVRDIALGLTWPDFELSFIKEDEHLLRTALDLWEDQDLSRIHN